MSFRFVPMTAVQIVTVLWNTRQVDDTEQGAVARPVGIIRRRFTQIVETGPYELTDTVRQVFMLDKVVFRQV